jgi:hypothetical protein
MEWLSNANTLASLVLAIFGIGGYIYGITTYLKKRASPTRSNTTGLSPAGTTSSQKSSDTYQPFSWLEWTQIFAQGLVDTADFIIAFIFPKEYDPKKDTVISKLTGCLMLCGMGVIVGGFFLALIIGVFLSILGVKDPTAATIVITTIVLFTIFSFVYIYHVGLRIEKKQQELMQEVQSQQSAKR